MNFPFINKFKQWFSGLFQSGWLKAILPQKLRPPLTLPSPDVLNQEGLPKQYAKHPCSNYMDLKMRFRDIGRMNAIIETLGRDFLTAMPEGAYKSRLGQIAFLARRMHEDLANKEVAELIEKAHTHEHQCPQDWDEWDSANLFEMETMYRHHCRVEAKLMEKRARLSYEGRRRHRQVLKDNDWESAKGFLQEMIDLQRVIAESKCLEDNDHKTDGAYQALMREYMPGARLNEIDHLFGEFKTRIDQLLPQVQQHQQNQPALIPLEGPFPSQLQLWLNKSLLKVLGFDFNRGGLYETGHNPVEGGHQMIPDW